jgi:flagellin-specific chaperone FliS
MTYKHNQGYQHNPLMDSTSKQLSFLFGRIAHFIEEADRLRLEKRFEEFVNYNQRAISIIHSLMSFFEGELNEQATEMWKFYFSKLLARLGSHMIEPEENLFKQICESIREIEQQLKDIDIQTHIQISHTIVENEIANENLNTPTNHNMDKDNQHERVTSTTATGINLSI